MHLLQDDPGPDPERDPGYDDWTPAGTWFVAAVVASLLALAWGALILGGAFAA